MGQQPPIIDMRNRPTWLHPFFGGAPGTPDYEVVRWLNKRVGSLDVDHFTKATDLNGYLSEIAAAEIVYAFMVGRSTPSVHISNDDLADLARKSGGKLIAVASVDPVALGAKAACAEVERALGSLELAALNVDAGFYARPLLADDPLLLPLYEIARAHKVPVFIMSGPTTPDLAYNDPRAVGRVAAQFKDLPLIVSHGLYPYVDEAVTIAFRHENVFLSPDMYMFAPGGQLYIEAANGFMADQYLFGTSYPFRAMRQSVDDLRALGLTASVLDKVSGRTAAGLFDLSLG